MLSWLHDPKRLTLLAETYSAVVIMVIVTTLITPPALNWSLERGSAPARS
ncbi:MAG: hypothetical protein AB1714_10685 [Acidobacteriota bacterium]